METINKKFRMVVATKKGEKWDDSRGIDWEGSVSIATFFFYLKVMEQIGHNIKRFDKAVVSVYGYLM
jgi:hypothetical protein